MKFIVTRLQQLSLLFVLLLIPMEAFSQEKGKIELTTAKKVGDEISFQINVAPDADFTIEGVEFVRDEDPFKVYRVTSQAITLKGDFLGFNCSELELTSLDVTACPSLKILWCYSNKLPRLDLSNCAVLKEVNCYGNQITDLKLPATNTLVNIYCDNNKLTQLDVTALPSLEVLECWKNELETLNVKGCSAMLDLKCYENKLTSLDLSTCTALQELRCYTNQLTSLNVKGCKDMTYLNCYNNQLAELKVTDCPLLKRLYCFENQLTELDLTKQTKLGDVNISSNKINGKKMSALMTSLSKVSFGTITLVNFEDDKEENKAFTTDVEIAKAKGWVVQAWKKVEDKLSLVPYEGEVDNANAFIASKEISFYPNPAKDWLVIKGLSAKEEVRIYDMTGRLIIKERAAVNGSLRLDLSSLESAYYIICTEGASYRFQIQG